MRARRQNSVWGYMTLEDSHFTLISGYVRTGPDQWCRYLNLELFSINLIQLGDTAGDGISKKNQSKFLSGGKHKKLQCILHPLYHKYIWLVLCEVFCCCSLLRCTRHLGLPPHESLDVSRRSTPGVTDVFFFFLPVWSESFTISWKRGTCVNLTMAGGGTGYKWNILFKKVYIHYDLSPIWG